MSTSRPPRDEAVYFGSFDAEQCWRPDDLAALPQLPDPIADRLVACMDEALVTAAAPGDLLVTRRPVSEAHRRALETAGFGCAHRHVGGPDNTADVEHQLLGAPELLSEMGRFRKISPYAVLPGTTELAKLTGHTDAVPQGETVARVNGKAWSSCLSARHGLPGAGHVVCSAAELDATVRSIADQGYPVVLVKDTYGVAGRGTLEVASDRRLGRLVARLRGQEEQGLRVELVVQPRYDRVADFSSHLHLDRDGSWRLLGVQNLTNAGYRHAISGPAPRDLTSALVHPSLPEVLDTVAGRLAGEGYFGPACIDSMVLRDGTWIPILEVNARMSMGGLNLRLDERVREHGLRSHLWQQDVTVPEGFTVDLFLRALRAAGLLYEGGGVPGVLPLVGGSLVAPRGRLICAAICPAESFGRVRSSTLAVASSAGVALVGAA
ncbi:hypothetical protein BJY54_006941 [Streptomyces nodosus]|uniref:Uncharacterized protein n=1 Tax=Streptomyces nodosus TaxID=40318 RepID=A0A5P2VYU9_9ACTN|nr:hypothetical protein [Streptomyces nodosus]MBB4796237.1 hypothetical protein [Streptomyces nodosus]QEV37217.1 hypothetical protein CP978_00135 [Streptomyces nodosus]